MYLDDPDIELLDNDFERMAPFLDSSLSSLILFLGRSMLGGTSSRIVEQLLRRKQGYRSIAIAGHRLPFGVESIWRHIDYAERMRSIVISSQKWMEIHLGVDIESSRLWRCCRHCSASLHTLLDFVVENAVRSLAALGLNNDAALLAVQQAYDEADAQAGERFLFDANVTANESLPGRAQILRLPSFLRHESRQLALDLKSLIQHRRAHQCFHLRAVLLKGRHGTTTSTSQVSDPTSKAKLSEHGEMHSSVLRGFVHSMRAARLETVSGVARSLRWTGQGTFSRFLTANETENIGYIKDGRKEAIHGIRQDPIVWVDRRKRHVSYAFGVGSLVCFVLKRGMISVSCDASNIGEERLSIGLGSYISR
ncbi:BQ5605_C013g07179 [Microbotryum silenes-dioicae]|uniref:BQ5605_C013g07179 protein n=1 Tax=Microbotryum silenes-dioicae TaxID=796604 RepID=A0A2X0LVR4_9BASI|nr:BQ5605_C013g07179 [Microbotryum silenes-dioicae]